MEEVYQELRGNKEKFFTMKFSNIKGGVIVVLKLVSFRRIRRRQTDTAPAFVSKIHIEARAPYFRCRNVSMNIF